MSSTSLRWLLYLTVVVAVFAGFGVWAVQHTPTFVAVARQPQARNVAQNRLQPKAFFPPIEEPAPFNEPPRFFQKGFKGFSKKARPSLSERLGVRVEKPSEDTLLQLGLAETDGLSVEEVRVGSVAAMAGVKVGDILLSLDGQNVPSDVEQFHFQLDNLKTEQALDAVLLRNGQMKTLKGLVLPEPAAPRFGPRRQFDN